MIYFKNILKPYFLLTFFLSGLFAFSQGNKREELESRRQELRQEIQKINSLQAENKSKEKSELSLIQEYNYKISVVNNLIKVTNQQANLLTRDINNNQNRITSLRKELETLKEDYAGMVVKSYKSKNQQSRIMFLLSSNDFKQAYKRLQYIKQYSDYQKQQGESIKTKTAELQQTNRELAKQKEDKQQLIAENRELQKSLEKDKAQHQSIMNSIRKNISMYASQIKQKQREADRIDREIENIIKAAIASSNRKAGNTSASTSSEFALTAEEKVLAANFVDNKGKLPWPVNGHLILGYGTQPSLIDSSIKIQSNGVRIATKRGAQVKAVFNGEVSRITLIKNANPTVMIRHGNYITVYKNLSKVYVKEGDKVTTNQTIGEVFTNPSDGETVLNFSVFNNAKTENPAYWIYKM